MEVKGITPGLICVGKIKIGQKGEEVVSDGGTKFKQPEKLDHFILITNEVDDEDRAVPDEKLMEIVKANPNAVLDGNKNLVGIPVVLLYDDPNLNLPHQRASVVGGKFACTGDGEVGNTRDNRTVKCPCEKAVETGYSADDKCKLSGTVSCVIEGGDSFGGCHKMYTTGNSVRFLLGSMSTIATATGGMLRGIPLQLIIQPRKTSVPGAGFITVYNVGLVFPGKVESLQEIALNMARDRATYFQKMEQIEENARRITYQPSASDEKAIADEFYPEAAAEDAPIDIKAEPETTPTPTDKDKPPEEGDENTSSSDGAPSGKGPLSKDVDVNAGASDEQDAEESGSETTNDTDQPATLQDPKSIKMGSLPEDCQMEIQQLSVLKKELGITDMEAWKKLLSEYGVVSAKQMTIFQLKKFRGQLEDMRPS